MSQPDEIKRAVCTKVFDGFDALPTLFVRHGQLAENTYELEEIHGEIVDEGDLYRVVRYPTAHGPRYYEIRVKEIL